MSGIAVSRLGGDRFSIEIRDHELIVDQPLEVGGTDAGPTPTELFVASLASCVAFYAGRFLRRHAPSDAPFRVDCEFRMSDERPSRVVGVDIVLELPLGLDDEVRAGALRAAEHCTVHSSLRLPPEVRIGLREPAAVSA